MRTIGIATFARSEYSGFLPLLRALRAPPEVQSLIWVGGMHLDPRFGETWREIVNDGFPIHDRIEMPMSSDTPEAVTRALGHGLEEFARSFARRKPDILVLAGDRTELLAAASAALIFGVPVAHVSGGDTTEGAIDNQVRFAVSKMSHLHFVAMQAHADRLLQIGEEPWRVHVTGDPALDLLRETTLMSRAELADSLGLELIPPVVAVTYHPTTLGETSAATEMGELIAALSDLKATLVITYPNADAGHDVIIERWCTFVAGHPRARLFTSLGQVRFHSLLGHADLMVGNSSSGIWEAPSFQLPVVNIGDRQLGRYRAANVVDAPPRVEGIAAAIQRALTPEFRRGLVRIVNPYGDGHAGERIALRLREALLGPALLRKRFITEQERKGGV